MPEAIEAYETYLAQHEEDHAAEGAAAVDDHDHHGHHEEAFPMVFSFFVVGFLLMLFLDQVLFKKVELKSKEEKKTSVSQMV